MREETGIDGRLVEKLGDVRYWYTRDGKRVLKVVSFFLFRYRSGTVRDDQRRRGRRAPSGSRSTRRPIALAYQGEKRDGRAALSKLRRQRLGCAACSS